MEAQQINHEPVSAQEVLTGLPPLTPGDVTKPQTDDRVAPKFQALLKRERTAIDRERSVKTLEEAIEARERQLQEREKKVHEFETLKEKNPTRALELLGLSYQDLTQIMLSDGTIPPEVEVKRVEDKVDSFLRNEELKEQKRLEDEKAEAAAREQKAANEFKSEIYNHIKSNPDRYEFITFERQEDLVYDVIDGHYERTKNPETGLGEILTIAQGADKVEEYLEKKYVKARDLKKLQALLAKRQDPIASKLQNTSSQKPKTLTNQLSATQQALPKGVLTDEERIRRAIAYAKNITR